MMALPRQEGVDVAEAHTEVATVVTVASIIMGNVEDIEEAIMVVSEEDTEEAIMVVNEEDTEEAIKAVIVEDTGEAIVEDTVEVTEAIEATSEASEVANEVESVVWCCPYLIVIRI